MFVEHDKTLTGETGKVIKYKNGIKSRNIRLAIHKYGFPSAAKCGLQ